MNLDSLIEATLFFRSEPISIKKLSELLEKTEAEIIEALNLLENKLADRGVRLMRKEDEVTLATASDASALIEKITKEELSKDLGKAGLETLSIILYKGPISRREIDYIRGVNSNFILRNLLIRGLIEKVQNKDDQRSFLYKPTFDVLSYLGVSKIEDLPEYEEVKKEIEEFNKQPEDLTPDPTEAKEEVEIAPEIIPQETASVQNPEGNN